MKIQRALPVLFLALTGCALTHPTDPYAPVRGGYRGAPGPRPSPARHLADAPEQPLTLPQCVEVALVNSPQIAQRFWDAEAADAQRDAAAAQRWPSVSAVGGYRRHLDDQRLVGARGPAEVGTWGSDIFSADLVVSMPLFTGGRIVNEIRAADLLRRAAEDRLARTRSELVFNVSSTFYSILGQRRVIESLEFSRKALEEHRKRVEDLMAAQKAAKVDLLRTEVRLADIEQRLVRARNVLAVQRRVLANLMGLTDERVPEVSGELVLDLVQPAEDAVARAFSRREDYRAARAEVAAQARRTDAARAARWPALSLVGSFGRRWATGVVTRQPGADTFEDVGSVGLAATVPLFEGGRLAANVRREEARLASAQEALREMEMRIRLEVQTAVLNLTSSLERARATEKAIEQGRESLRIEREKYDLGKGAITDVLDAQSAVLDAETNHAQALAEYNIAAAQYRLALGDQ